MRIPLRIALPLVLALLGVAALLAALFVRLENARSILQMELPWNDPLTETGAVRETPQTYVDENDALLHIRRGDMAALQGDWEEAELGYARAVELDGGKTAQKKLANAQMQRRHLREARATLEQLQRMGADDEDTLLLMVGIDIREGELARAVATVEQAEESPQKHYAQALIAIIGRDHETATLKLKQVTGGWDPVLRAYAGQLLAAYDEYALFPDSPEIHLLTLLSRALAQVQECELALPILTQVTTEQDDYRDAWIVQGYCELTTERYPEALASFERAYNLDPQKPEIQYFLARSYSKNGDHQNAITFLHYAIANNFQPEEQARKTLAKEAITVGNPQLALDQFSSLTQREEATLETFREYIEIAMTAGYETEAMQKAQEAVARWSEDAAAHELLGWTAMQQEAWEAARTALEKARELDPDSPSIQTKLDLLEERTAPTS